MSQGGVLDKGQDLTVSVGWGMGPHPHQGAWFGCLAVVTGKSTPLLRKFEVFGEEGQWCLRPFPK